MRILAQRFSSLILTAAFALAACGPALTRDGMPPPGRGSFSRDEFGIPEGTGWQAYLYPSGQVKRREAFVEGVLQRTIWYRPDGSVVATTNWNKGSGIGYELRDDGSIKTKTEYVRGLADGEVVSYRPDGSVEKTQLFVHGEPAGNP